ncbi:MAG: tetratricopeptide repeat protein [bacterium]|nr:tetratricopeptide repeat protein [bacterium]
MFRLIVVFIVVVSSVSANEYINTQTLFIFCGPGLEDTDYSTVLAEIEAVLEKDPNNTEFLYLKGLCLDQLGRDYEALDAYDDVLSLDPENAFALNSKGIILAEKGDSESALRMFEHAIKVCPDLSQPYNNKGSALRKINKLKEAIKAFDQALKIETDNLIYLTNKAFTLVSMGKDKDALKVFTRITEIKPDEIAAWEIKKVHLISMGKYDDALDCCEKMIVIEPENASAWEAKGEMLIQKEEFEDALDAFNTALIYDPDLEIANFRKAGLANMYGDFEGAKSASEKALTTINSVPQLYFILGASNYCLGEYREGIIAFDEYFYRGNDARSILYTAIGLLLLGDSNLSFVKPELEKSGNEWIITLGDFLVGDISEKELLNVAGRDKAKKFEAYLYAGLKAKASGDEARAQELLGKTKGLKMDRIFEDQWALIELDNLADI